MSIEKPSSDPDAEPQPPTLGELARILGFEPNADLREIRIILLTPELSEADVIRLLDQYSVEANIMCVAENKRTPRDDLALMVELAFFRYIKGKFVQLLQDFEDMREILQSPDIDDETYALVMATIRSIEEEIARWRQANPATE